MESAASERSDPQFGVALIRLNVDGPSHERSDLLHRQKVCPFGSFIERPAEESGNLSFGRHQRLALLFDQHRHAVQSRHDASLLVEGCEGYPYVQELLGAQSILAAGATRELITLSPQIRAHKTV